MDLFERVREDIKTAMKATRNIKKHQESIPGSKDRSGRQRYSDR